MDRREYEMTESQLAKVLDACKPVPYLIVGGHGPRSPQENATDAWARLGEEMGFDHMTAQPVPGKGNGFFTAVPTSGAKPPMAKCYACLEKYPESERKLGTLAGPCCREKEAKSGLRIVFDGPPGPESGRFVETELDGKGFALGEWEQQGNSWLLVLPESMAEIARRSL